MRIGRIPLVIFCVVCMAGLLGLQCYWIQKHYVVTKANFEKEVNIAFEDAVKKEFSLRCDTVEQSLIRLLMDTNAFVITSKLNKDGDQVYTFRNKRDVKDHFSSSLSYSDLNIPIIEGDTVNKFKVVKKFAKGIRKTDLEDRVVFFRTQSLGKYLVEKVEQYRFDTARLKPIFDDFLRLRKINIPYRFELQPGVTSVMKNSSPAHTDAAYPITTRSFITYRKIGTGELISASFKNPFTYIVINMVIILLSSLLLVILIAFCLIYLLRTLFKEKKLSAVKNDFISNITHEFKTPIATIAAAVEALTSFDVLDDAEKTQRYLGHAKNELARLSGLVDQVLNIAIYSRANDTFFKEPVIISEVMDELMASYAVPMAKDIRFHYERKDLQYTVMANKVQFYHSLNNVIDNAIKYSGDQVDITLSSKVKNNFLQLCIGDCGAGIKSSDLPLVFDQFYRSQDAIAKKVKGYGLGLNYVKSIMENHDGWCKIESELGKGSKVILAWPV
jgi:two-component system phosphate regulon sensor histidine kinase PhoR